MRFGGRGGGLAGGGGARRAAGGHRDGGESALGAGTGDVAAGGDCGVSGGGGCFCRWMRRGGEGGHRSGRCWRRRRGDPQRVWRPGASGPGTHSVGTRGAARELLGLAADARVDEWAKPLARELEVEDPAVLRNINTPGGRGGLGEDRGEGGEARGRRSEVGGPRVRGRRTEVRGRRAGNGQQPPTINHHHQGNRTKPSTTDLRMDRRGRPGPESEVRGPRSEVRLTTINHPPSTINQRPTTRG